MFLQSSSSCGDVFLPSENGLLAFGLPPAKDAQDPELINAGKEFVTMLTGGCFFHHGDSFAMMRGGHLDLCVYWVLFKLLKMVIWPIGIRVQLMLFLLLKEKAMDSALNHCR